MSINSELCQKCAACCKSWWIYTDLKDDVIRASWLNSKDIHVVKVSESLWKIIFDIPCIQLVMKDDKYFCKQHNGARPGYCKEYPHNFLDASKAEIDTECKMCPWLKELVKNGS